MKCIEVNQSGPLFGDVHIQGSKNSALGLLAATCLADEPVSLKRIPNILDFRVICDIGREIGMEINTNLSGDLVIDPRKIHTSTLDPKKTASFRASYYFVGALLAKFRKVSIGYPGGDDFGSRPIDQHIKAFQALGATFTFHNDYYTVEAERLRGADITFDVITSGATINVMLAAVLALGKTTLHNAARDPEVVDVANLLNKMGAHIRGAGTDTITIDGVTHLDGCDYTCIPDRLIAGAFMMVAGVTGGTLTIKDVIPEHLASCIAKLKEIGLSIETHDNDIIVSRDGLLRATRVRSTMYPGFATDLQQPLTALLLQPQGRSIVTDKVYPNRFNHVKQLTRMGAKIDVRGSSSFIQGGQPLKGTWVSASDVRAGTCLILAGLTAEGPTYITGVEHIERGYENVIEVFQSIGANVKLRLNKAMEDLRVETM